MRKGRAGDAVAAAASKKAPHTVLVKDLKPSKLLSRYRPGLAAVKQNRPHRGLVHAAFGLERNLSSGPQYRFRAGKGAASKANPFANFDLSLTLRKSPRI